MALLVWSRRLLEGIDPATLVVLTLAATTLRWVLTAVATSAALVVGAQVLHTFTFSVFHLAAQRLLARLVPPESSAGGQALYGFVGFGIGGSLGLWLAGALVDEIGTAQLFAVEAVVSAAAVVPALALVRLGRR